MRLKTLLLLGALISLVFSVLSQVPPKSFFLDEEGKLQCIIVVGAEAASSDEVAASIIAAKIGNMGLDPKTLLPINQVDIEITEEEKQSYNLILVGGPVVNSLVQELVESGKSKIDWYTSEGEIEYIKDPWGYGTDVIIVAGMNREATRKAAEELVKIMFV